MAELTDKDAVFMLVLSAKMRAPVVFAAGALAFTCTTTIIVLIGALLIHAVPIQWIRVAGGAVMLGYGLWAGRGLILGEVPSEEGAAGRMGNGWKAFLAIVASLALLDLAGDATEVLTIVFVAQYSDPPLVFLGAVSGLVAASAFEAALGNSLGRLLTPKRVRALSMVVFVSIGGAILLTSL